VAVPLTHAHTPLIADAGAFRAWLKQQASLHFHLRILGNGTDASWVIVRSRTALCEDETRCVILPVY
jgi:hypothetical protein